MYDVVMSLGYNCEISFRLENYFGKINAMPFSWSYVVNRDYFADALQNIDNLFAGEVGLLEDNMILCENFRIKFHPRYEILLRDGKPTEESLQEAIAELRNRVAYLKEKFKSVLAGTQRTLFIMKVEDLGEGKNIQYIQEIAQVLDKLYVSKNYTLLVVMERGSLTKKIEELETERLRVRAVKKFAPRKHTDTMGDIWGWWKILNEFSGEKHYKYFIKVMEKRFKWLCAVIKKYWKKLYSREG